jgi:hypothetical protein
VRKGEWEGRVKEKGRVGEGREKERERERGKLVISIGGGKNVVRERDTERLRVR